MDVGSVPTFGPQGAALQAASQSNVTANAAAPQVNANEDAAPAVSETSEGVGQSYDVEA